MLRLYIVRHGETEWNTQKRMQGRKDSSLTEKGVEAAKALGRKLTDVELACIYSSSSRRALRTAELIRGDRRVDIIPDDNLQEIYLGEWEGKTLGEVESMDKHRFKAFWEAPHLYEPISGENFFQVRDRIARETEKIISRHAEGNIMIVTHAVIVKTLMSIFKDEPVERLWASPFVHGTSLCVVEIDKNTRNVVLEGDVSHLNDQRK